MIEPVFGPVYQFASVAVLHTLVNTQTKGKQTKQMHLQIRNAVLNEQIAIATIEYVRKRIHTHSFRTVHFPVEQTSEQTKFSDRMWDAVQSNRNDDKIH